MNDALGNEIVIGSLYGYSTTDTVFIGRVRNLSKTRVTLLPIRRRYFLYGEETTRPWLGDAETVSVASYHLFPIKE